MRALIELAQNLRDVQLANLQGFKPPEVNCLDGGSVSSVIIKGATTSKTMLTYLLHCYKTNMQ